VVSGARFQQEHPVAGALTQSVGEHAARRSAAYDDEIVALVPHAFPLDSRPDGVSVQQHGVPIHEPTTLLSYIVANI